MSFFLRSYGESAESRELELQPIHDGSPSAPVASLRRKRWHLPPWEEIISAIIEQPRVQGRLWLVAAGLVMLVAAVVLVSSESSGQQANSGPGPRAQPPFSTTSSSPNARSSSTAGPGPFPVEPWLQPLSAKCSSTSTAAGSLLGPGSPVQSPLNYRVLLAFEEAHFAAGDASGAVAAGFQAAANVTLAIHQDTSCVSLHATNLSFTSIIASLLTHGSQQEQGDEQQQQQQVQLPPPVCLCGNEPSCQVVNCARLFKAKPDSDSWLLSLGPLLAPAGSSLLLATRYTAYFGNGQGVWRSSPFTSSPPPAAAVAAAAAADAGPDAQQPQQQVLINTQFEARAARTVYPCMDEPTHKATIVVSVEAPAHLVVLSNMPEAARHTSSNSSRSRVVVEFLPSPPMSTYLMAIAVGAMQAVAANTSRHQLVRVWAPSVAGWQAASGLPLQLALAAFDHYDRYTRVAQPLTKFDLVAVPGKTGAVENWGLLLFDVDRFLYTSPGAWSLFRCADVICHEVAHQWFGNLVTAHTLGGDLLVNEGLASLMEYGCMGEVLAAQLGRAGAAALMRQVVGPHGRAAGVHEGPFAKALSYDALPGADPLLGSTDVDFGVLPYSKASAVMASLALYGATASADGPGYQAASMYGPIAALTAASPPWELQMALQQYLQRNIYGTATAQAVLELFLGVTPDNMASNALAVTTGLRSPGSPLLTLQHTTQGSLQVQQRRLCSVGLLQDTILRRLLDTPWDSSSTSRVPTPPLAANGTVASATTGADSGLSCPVVTDDGERAIPWTPVYLRLLPVTGSSTHNTSSSAGAAGEDEEDDYSSRGRSKGAAGGAVCGSWQVIMRDTQLLELPACAAADPIAGASAGASGDSSLWVLEGDGGWGLHWSLYPASERAVARGWVMDYLLPLLQQQPGGQQGSTVQHESPNLLFVAAKLLQDQVTLGLSPFGEVPGWEVVEALRAAAATTTAAAAGGGYLGGSGSTGSGGTVGSEGGGVGGAGSVAGFGGVTYTLLAPLLPLVDVLMERLAVNASCWINMQAELASNLRPVAVAAMQAFAPSATQASSGNSSGTGLGQYTSPNQFLGAMSLSTLVTAAGLADPTVAGILCKQFNAAAAAAGGDAAALLAQLQPDLQDAVLNVAAAQPPGCSVDMAGDQLVRQLQKLYLTALDPTICHRAAFALAHAAAQGSPQGSDAGPTPGSEGWQDVLGFLLGVSHAKADGVPAAEPACGIPASAHAVQLAKIASRGVVSSQTRQTAAASSAQGPQQQQPWPVVHFMQQYWQQALSALGQEKAWQVLQAAAAQEVVTVQQWQQLAAWAAQQYREQQPESGDVLAAKQHAALRQHIQSLLGYAWSTVSWAARNAGDVCSRLL